MTSLYESCKKINKLVISNSAHACLMVNVVGWAIHKEKIN